ncbi:MAG: NAD-dependent epimerase/dehydratase family protein [Burkholderiaceae bacterium]
MANRVLVTGAAGFIGAHAAAALHDGGWHVLACDNFNPYYSPQLKHDRVAALLTPRGIACAAVDISDAPALNALFAQHQPSHVLHLAAQAGVRHSLVDPGAYVQSNLVGFGHVLEACRHGQVQHLAYASSSSVYGARNQTPFRETDAVTQPTSLYAATKAANELMAHSYAHLFALPSTGLRFFTVYGPWGRPDMAYFSFARNIRAGQPITLFAGGELQRDFTYIADVVQAITQLLAQPAPALRPELQLAAPHTVCNIGNRQPVTVLEFVRLLEAALGRKAQLQFAPMQPGDVPLTSADTTRLKAWTGFEPHTPLGEGLKTFARWLEGWEPLV